MHHAPTPEPERLGPELADWEIALVRQVVKGVMGGQRRFAGVELDDLVQESLAHWLAQRPRYQPRRGAASAFLRKLVTARLLDLRRIAAAAKRGSTVETVSLDAPRNEGADDELPLGDQLARPEDIGVEDEAVSGLSRGGLLSRLTPRQRDLALGLEAGFNLSELSRRLRVPRTTLDDELERIKRLFRDEGLLDH